MADYEPHECPYRERHRGDISACAWCEFDPLTDNPRLLDRPFTTPRIVTFKDWLEARDWPPKGRKYHGDGSWTDPLPMPGLTFGPDLS